MSGIPKARTPADIAKLSRSPAAAALARRLIESLSAIRLNTSRWAAKAVPPTPQPQRKDTRNGSDGRVHR